MTTLEDRVITVSWTTNRPTSYAESGRLSLVHCADCHPAGTLAIHDRTMNDQAYVRREIVCPGNRHLLLVRRPAAEVGAWPQSGCGCPTPIPEVDYSRDTAIVSIVRISAIAAERKRRSFRGRLGRVTRECPDGDRRDPHSEVDFGLTSPGTLNSCAIVLGLRQSSRGQPIRRA